LAAEVQRLADVRRAFRVWLHDHDVDHPEDVILAVDEAVSNAIEHSGQNRVAPVFIDVVARSDGEEICVEVTDEGSWRPRRGDTMRGRGLNIIDALMDRVEVASSSAGTRVIMRRDVTR
jgi:anti-sigma regulatory factor (Ser/Thr protein kinase)